jgi:catechol 2,3-dioxygenase-like lactoylglutathione lyase family enzyme
VDGGAVDERFHLAGVSGFDKEELFMSTATATSSTSLTSGGGPTIFVRDIDKAVAFYTQTLGFRVLYQAGPHFAMIDAGNGLQIGLHPPGKNAAAPGTRGSIQVGLTVTRPIADAVRELESRGVRFDTRPGNGRAVVDDGAVKLAFFTDPDGNDLYLCEVKKPQ